MSRKVVILKGSPRPKGNSAFLADTVAKAAQEAGAEVTSFYLHGMNIHPCNHCDACQKRKTICVVPDDMREIFPKLIEADAIVLASPIYWFTFTAQLKTCIDRWYSLQGEPGDKLKGKEVGILITYGDSDPYTSGAINAFHTFESMFCYLRCKMVGMVYGTAMDIGDIEKQPALLTRAAQLGTRLGRGELPT
ncbi:MAG TPA: flavodoxin family protein [Longilinea sp.]|nr:flavodoxin family protein [Longilinea sp.]